MPAEGRGITYLQTVQTDSRVHSAYDSMAKDSPSSGYKMAEPEAEKSPPPNA